MPQHPMPEHPMSKHPMSKHLQGPIEIDPQTRDIIMNEYLCEVYKGVDGNMNDLLGDQIDTTELEYRLQKNRRQVNRLVAKGMPYIQLGRERIFSLRAVEKWLSERQTTRGAPPRRRGRPRIGSRDDHRGGVIRDAHQSAEM